MVDDLFELSRIHAGTLDLSPQPLMLGDLVSEAIAGADPVARVRNVRLGGKVEDGVEVTADAQGLSRVLANLIMNAVRHTPADGRGSASSTSPGGVGTHGRRTSSATSTTGLRAQGWAWPLSRASWRRTAGT